MMLHLKQTAEDQQLKPNRATSNNWCCSIFEKMHINSLYKKIQIYTSIIIMSVS